MQELFRRDVARLAEGQPFDHIEAALATQDIAEDRLADVHLLSEFILGKIAVSTYAGEHSEEYGVLLGIYGFCHPSSVTNQGSYKKTLIIITKANKHSLIHDVGPTFPRLDAPYSERQAGRVLHLRDRKISQYPAGIR